MNAGGAVQRWNRLWPRHGGFPVDSEKDCRVWGEPPPISLREGTKTYRRKDSAVPRPRFSPGCTAGRPWWSICAWRSGTNNNWPPEPRWRRFRRQSTAAVQRGLRRAGPARPSIWRRNSRCQPRPRLPAKRGAGCGPLCPQQLLSWILVSTSSIHFFPGDCLLG